MNSCCCNGERVLNNSISHKPCSNSMYNAYQFQVSTISNLSLDADSERTQALVNTNLTFLSGVLPELYSMLLNSEGKRYSLFYSETGSFNLRDNQSGEALYAGNVYQEVEDEVQSFFTNPVSITLNPTAPNDEIEGLPDKATVLVFGVGCGYHLKLLLESGKLSALVIYEADLDLLKTSLYFTSWAELFALAEQNSVLLAVQPGSAVANIKSHLCELAQAGLFNDRVCLYRHTYNALTEEVYRYLLANSGNQQVLLQGEGRFLGMLSPLDYLPVRPAGVLGNTSPDFSINEQHQALFDKNLRKLSELYPEIANFYNNYKPQRWLFCQDSSGLDNIYHLPSKTFAYHDCNKQSAKLAELFIENPYRETAIYSQTFQEKLAKYIHFQKIYEVERLQSQLPKSDKLELNEIRSLALFGSGLGRYIENTLRAIMPKNIFVFEEDPDIFFASLYATDWSEIISKVESEGGHLYFNIGCEPDSYLGYFLYQLHIVGAYELSNTFLFPSYYRPHLQKSISELRAQLRTFIGLNEYYDNARYAITHFMKNADNGAFFMKETIAKKIEFPVFVIGNGPSLDSLIPYVIENRDNAVIISCGTALKALYEYGIKPDFHAEVEQNSATFGWITKVPDRDYLKSINFISTAAAFPETVALFKNAYLAFSFAQVPYKFFSRVEPDISKNFIQLHYAFPTVSNFALDFVSMLGFAEVYLLGVDLGYVNLEHHHSKKSAYYSATGKDVYELSQKIAHPQLVKGNFEQYVFTKFEFDMARKVMEQAISANSLHVNFYNCSNGALISGAAPLKPEFVLIDNAKREKNEFLSDFFGYRFEHINQPLLSNFKQLLASDLPSFKQSVQSWIDIAAERVSHFSEIAEVISSHANKLKSIALKRNSLECLLLEGSALSFLGLMNSFANTLAASKSKNIEIFNQLLDIWQSYLVSVLVDVKLIYEKSCPAYAQDFVEAS